MKLAECITRKLRKHKVALRKVVDRHLSLSGKKISAASIERRPVDDGLPHLTKQIKSCYVRCTSSQPVVGKGKNAPLSRNVNITRRFRNVNITRMRIGLRCVKRWTRQILGKKTETNAFADFLRRMMPTSTVPASKHFPPPPQNTRRGTPTALNFRHLPLPRNELIMMMKMIIMMMTIS